MTIRVSELVEMPHLHLEVLAGSTGLERLVTWAHASDLPEPWDFLAGGELLMKNGRTMARSAARQAEFLDRLTDSGVTALVIGTDPMTPRLGRRAAERANERALPVLGIPYSMSFIPISRAVAEASMEAQARRMSRIERIYAAGHTPTGPVALGTLVHRLETEVGHRVYLVDPITLAPVVAESKRPDAQLTGDLREVIRGRGTDLPAVLHLPRREGRFGIAVSVPYEEPTLLVAVSTGHLRFDLSMLHHAAMAAAVAMNYETLVREAESRAGSVELAQLLTSSHSPRLPVLQEGWKTSIERCRLLATLLPSAEVQRRLVSGFRRRGVAHLTAVADGALWILAENVGPGTLATDVLRDRLGERTPVGASMTVGTAARVPEAAREAWFALGVARQRGEGTIHFEEAGSSPACRHPDEARALSARVLGPLLDYDQAHGTDLVESLAAFLDCRRSWSRAAKALNVHRQTVVYRMKRVAELTGRDLAETPDVAELWLAISAYRLLRTSA